MAEVVERNLESSLDEILYIKKSSLFKKHEISELIRRRRQHEYSLQKRNKRVLDYDSYITTEIVILKLLRLRRQKTEEQRFVDKIERSIITRLVRLHRQLCYRFQSRIDLWMRFIQFSCLLGRHMSAVRLWNRVLQVHGRTDPRLWAAAASYHLHQNTKAKIKSTRHNLSKEFRELSERKDKIQSELNALNRYLKKKDRTRVLDLIKELNRTRVKLQKATSSLNVQRRIIADRVYLTAIREARRLLTEGITLNPECDALHLELLKLEANAADFFKSRILPKLNLLSGAAEENKPDVDETEQTMDVDVSEPTVDTSTSQIGTVKDCRLLLKEVTEDIRFLASGGAFNLVLRSLLDRWSDNQDMLNEVHKLTLTMSHFCDEQSQAQLEERLEKISTNTTKEVDQKKQDSRATLHDPRSKLRDQMTQLCQAMMSDSPVEAVNLWNSWYTVPSTGSDLFRTVDPSLDEAVALFRTRLSILTIQTNWCASTDRESAHHLSNQKKQELIRQTRSWLDGLATSRWGEQCPEFWIQYLSFERDCGDCTRLPSVQWRASKILNPNAYRRFTHLLNSAAGCTSGATM